MRSEPPAQSRRVIVDVAAAPFASYVSERDEWSEDEDVALAEGRNRAYLRACTVDMVSSRLGVSRQRVQQIEAIALQKIQIAFELEARLGVERAVGVLTGLRGAPLSAFREALASHRIDDQEED